MKRRNILSALVVSAVTMAGCATKGHNSSRYNYDPVDYEPYRSAKVLRTAMTQYGKPYSYGHANPYDGFDCSGLVYWAYQQNGIKVPRHTSGQRYAGKAVSAKNTRQGDIVVFRVNKKLHTGLVADQGRFLHSPSEGGYVRMEYLTNPYWRKRIIGYRRIVN